MGSLEKYHEKRDFSRTPEPRDTRADPEELNRFVIQWHHARRKHYDFRLQIGNVLASWAIPKKPVDDPDVKRLAVKVEDHPLSYIHFEGTIPEGNYGAGNVMVWDIGYYYLGEEKSFPTEGEMEIKIAKGSLKLYLQGTKLKGYYNLVKKQKGDDDAWFFMKARNEADRQADGDTSALTGRSMEEIAASDVYWDPEREKRSADLR